MWARPWLLFALLLPLGTAQALRCGTDLVTEGDHVLEVLEVCGEPAYRDQRVIYKTVRHRRPYHGHKEIQVPIVVEEWVYNFGPRRFMRRLRFYDGELVDVDTLGYGYRPR